MLINNISFNDYFFLCKHILNTVTVSCCRIPLTTIFDLIIRSYFLFLFFSFLSLFSNRHTLSELPRWFIVPWKCRLLHSTFLAILKGKIKLDLIGTTTSTIHNQKNLQLINFVYKLSHQLVYQTMQNLPTKELFVDTTLLNIPNNYEFSV